jgi:hypothetical protein
MHKASEHTFSTFGAVEILDSFQIVFVGNLFSFKTLLVHVRIYTLLLVVSST